MIQHIDSQTKKEAVAKSKIFVDFGSMVHCCTRQLEMTHLLPLTAPNAPDLLAGTWTFTLGDVSDQPHQIVLHDVLFTPARTASLLSVVKLSRLGWEIDPSRSFMFHVPTQ
jgi:hypothetical protein